MLKEVIGRAGARHKSHDSTALTKNRKKKLKRKAKKAQEKEAGVEGPENGASSMAVDERGDAETPAADDSMADEGRGPGRSPVR